MTYKCRCGKITGWMGLCHRCEAEQRQQDDDGRRI